MSFMAPDETTFNCLRCGTCCSNLLAEDWGILRGLTLLPEERELFPEPLVKPAIGVGRRPHGRGFRIMAYQLTEDNCPHLGEGSCSIYPDRPASCRQFPFSLRRGPEGKVQVGFDLNCPALVVLIEENQRVNVGSDARLYAEKLLDIELEALSSPKKAWFYDLRSGRWRRYSELLEV